MKKISLYCNKKPRCNNIMNKKVKSYGTKFNNWNKKNNNNINNANK